MDVLCAKFGLLWREFYRRSGNEAIIDHLTPKFHLIEKHLPATFRRFRCLRKFSDESIERIHHEWIDYTSIYKNITDWELRSIAIIKDSLIASSPPIAAILEKMKENTQRKSQNKKINKAKVQRTGKREETVANIKANVDSRTVTST